LKQHVPNILSSIRILLVPVFVLVYFGQESSIKIQAAVVYALASVTDFLDGFLARRYQLISNLGKVLDPLGDKLMTIAVLACIAIDGLIPPFVVYLVLVKELIMVVGGLIVRRKTKGTMPSSNIFGKTSTVVFFIICVTLMLFRGIPHSAAVFLIGVALVLMMAALVSYIRTFLMIMKKCTE